MPTNDVIIINPKVSGHSIVLGTSGTGLSLDPEFTRQAMISIPLRSHTKAECLHLVRTASKEHKDIQDFEKLCKEHAYKLEAFLKECHGE